MPALDYLPDIVTSLRKDGVPAQAIERYPERCFSLTQPAYALPCPYCHVTGRVAPHMTTVQSAPEQRQLLCTVCEKEFEVTTRGSSVYEERETMPDVGKDWAHRAAATLAIDLMKEMPALDEGRAITIAWMSHKKMEIDVDGPGAKFGSEQYSEDVAAGMLDIQTGRKERVENLDARRAARTRLGLA
jgi:hypothetical protein